MTFVPHQWIPIVGTGARTPLGLNAPATAAAVRAGLTAMQEHPFMLDKHGEPMVVALDAQLPAQTDDVDRLVALSLTPAHEALDPLLKSPSGFPPIDILIALPEERPGRRKDLEHDFIEKFGSSLPKEFRIQKLSCPALGHAGGIVCMQQAWSLIKSGRSKLCLIGGVESYNSAETLEWLDSQDQMHSESTIWGFCPGEAAAFCLLASRGLADELGLSALVNLLSVSSALEENLIKTDTVCIGEGLSEAFHKTLTVLSNDEATIDHTICDLNGEPYRANEYGFSMLRTGSRFSDASDFQTPAECWGDVGAASGTLFTVLAAFAAEKGYAPGPLTFLSTSSEGGQRGCALLQATAEHRGM
jgi:3-oxoacyl-[acyl-carrier-protein] synthase-1